VVSAVEAEREFEDRVVMRQRMVAPIALAGPGRGGDLDHTASDLPCPPRRLALPAGLERAPREILTEV
jgi:hypothetical protein